MIRDVYTFRKEFIIICLNYKEFVHLYFPFLFFYFTLRG